MIKDKEEVVGRRIVDILRSEYELEKGKGYPGLSLGDMLFCRFFLRLDNGNLLEIGTHLDGYPITIIPPTDPAVRDLVPVDFPESKQPCKGDTITDVRVNVIDHGIYLKLSSGRYLWVEDDLDGSSLFVERESDLISSGSLLKDELIEYFTSD